MNHTILLENHHRRIDVPLYRLVCFAMFTAWQMGFIYFMTPALVINGKTPLPMNMDNISLLIVAAYVISIIYMIVAPHLVVWGQRISALFSLVTILGLFCPLPEAALELLLYLHIFSCCFMIGFESFVISSLFTEKTAITHLTVAYGISSVIIAMVQNDTMPITFDVFLPVVVIMLLMQLYFYFSLPTSKKNCPRYVKKGDGLLCPKHLFSRLTIMAFISCLLMLCGPAAVADVPNGVSISYTADALGGIILYILYRNKKIHPLRWISVFMGFSAVGYLFLFLSGHVQAFLLPACILIGLGYIPCLFLPLYALVLIKEYPSRFIVPAFVSLALVTVVIQSLLVEVFRNDPQMLLLLYMAIMVVLAIIYLQLQPFLISTLQRNISKTDQAGSMESPVFSSELSSSGLDKSTPEKDLINQLTARELEVLQLISYGYSNKDISKILVLSEHTVKDYTKKIYRKLDVHNRHAATQMLLRSQSK